jgi:acyl dehydratase
MTTGTGPVGPGPVGPGPAGPSPAGPGAVLPELVIDVTPTFVIAAAIATRDFQDVHHDRDRAVERGGKDIFVNILTTTGLVQRYVTDWAGPQAMVRQIAIRLGVPCYAGDKLTFSGRVIQVGEARGVGARAGEGTRVGKGAGWGQSARVGEGAGWGQSARVGEGAGAEAGAGGEAGWDGRECVVEVVGRCSLGDHVTGMVRIGPSRTAP